MNHTPDRPTSDFWARFRFSVVGSLLSSPPARGELKAAIDALAEKTWTHPASGRDVRFATATIERWFHRARHEKQDPLGVLRRKIRKDRGQVRARRLNSRPALTINCPSGGPPMATKSHNTTPADSQAGKLWE